VPVKPDLIWLGINRFGPDHDEAAYDPVLQARAGFMELTGDAAGFPMASACDGGSGRGGARLQRGGKAL